MNASLSLVDVKDEPLDMAVHNMTEMSSACEDTNCTEDSIDMDNTDNAHITEIHSSRNIGDVSKTPKTAENCDVIVKREAICGDKNDDDHQDANSVKQNAILHDRLPQVKLEEDEGTGGQSPVHENTYWNTEETSHSEKFKRTLHTSNSGSSIMDATRSDPDVSVSTNIKEELTDEYLCDKDSITDFSHHFGCGEEDEPLSSAVISHTDSELTQVTANIHSGNSLTTNGELKGKIYACFVCEKTYQKRSILQKHLLIHSVERPHSCGECGKGFTQLAHLKQHVMTHTGERPNACTQCPKAFKQGSHLKKHMGIHADKRYTCLVCSEEFTRSTSLKQHTASHAGHQKTFRCQICSKNFSHGSSLRRHMLVHSGERPHKCDECGVSFTQSAHLKDHLQSHSGEKCHVCEVCHKKFFRSSHLKTHMIQHTGDKPYECHVCDKRFGYARSLTIHARTHSGERPYTCRECQKGFMDPSTLRRHMLTHSKVKAFSCPHCFKQFSQSGHLSEHMNIHSDHEPFTCEICGKTFSRLRYLKKHQGKYHRDGAVQPKMQMTANPDERCSNYNDPDNGNNSSSKIESQQV